MVAIVANTYAGRMPGDWIGPVPGLGIVLLRQLGKSAGEVAANGNGACRFGPFQIIEFPGAAAALSGTAVPSVKEFEVVTGGDTVIITLSDDFWVPAGTDFDGQRQAIIDGFVSAQSEAAGWNAVRPSIDVSAVARTSDTVVTLTLPALAGYLITANETITVTIPMAAIEEADMPINAGTFDIINQTPTTAALTGTVTPSVEEDAVVTGGGTLIITLTNGTWATAGANFDGARQGIIDGIVSAQSEAAGFNAQKTNIPVTAVARTSDTVVTVTLPPLPAYSITANETLTVTVPDAAFVQT